MIDSSTPDDVRRDIVTGRELAIIDLREEAVYAQGHPLFAAQIPPDRLLLEAPVRIPCRATRVVLYDDDGRLVPQATLQLREAGYADVRVLRGGLASWREARFELFADVNSYSKAFGELVEHRRRTPSLSAEHVRTLIEGGENMVVLDARPFNEYATMSIPGAINVPGAELVLRARGLAPDPNTTIVVNCAGRTRSLIGTQSLLNAGIPNPVYALRNGTIGWTLAGLGLAHGQSARPSHVTAEMLPSAVADSSDVAYRAGVRWIDTRILDDLAREADRTLYRFDVRSIEEYERGHLPGFRSAPGGQLVQEIDAFAPVRGARIVLADDLEVRANMTASWLAQMRCEVYVLENGFEDELETEAALSLPPRPARGRYKRPYEGIDNQLTAMRSYLEWEGGLVDQLARDGSHGFFVI